MEERVALVLQVRGGQEAVREIVKIDNQIGGIRSEIRELTKDSRNSTKEIEKVASELQRLASEGQKGSKEYQELSNRSKELNSALNDNSKQIEELRINERFLREERKQSNSELNKQIRDFRKFGQEVPNDSIEGLSRRYSELRKELRLIPKEIREFAESANPKQIREADLETLKLARRYRELSKEARDTREEIVQFDRGINDFTSSIGDYASAFRNLDFSGIFGGLGQQNITQIFENPRLGLESIRNAISSINPTSILIGGAIAGAVSLARHVRDVTLEYEKLFNTVNLQTGLGGLELQDATASLVALSKTFEDVDFNDLLTAANSVTRAFGGDFTDNLDAIEQGLFAIGTEQGRAQFLDDLREYPRLIERAGLSVDDFVELSIIQTRDGIFNDKLIDSVKESLSSLEEFTETQRKAISGALGDDFTNDLEQRIREGTTTTVQAIVEIGDNLIEGGADLQDYAAITADVTKAAGEDIGGIVKVYEALKEVQGSTLEELSASTTAYTERQRDLLEAEKQLAEQNTILAAQFAGIGTSFDSLSTRAKAFGTSILNNVTLSLRGAAQQIQDGDIIDGLTDLALGQFSLAASAFGFVPEEREAVIEEIRRQDADALAEQSKIEANQEKVRQEAIQREADLRKQEDERQKQREQNRIDAIKRQREETERLNKAIEEAQKAEQKRQEEIARAKERFANDEIRLQRELSNLRAQNDELDLTNLEEFQRQSELLNQDRESDIAAISPLLDPEQIQIQTDLINQLYDEQIRALKQKRDEANATAAGNEFDQTLNTSNLVDSSLSLDALNTFNSIVAEDPSLEVRIQAEKELQEILTQIQLDGLEERKALILADTTLTAEERLNLLTAIAEQEKALNAETNAEILEQQRESAQKQEELQKQISEATKQAVTDIGEAFGTFLVDSIADGEDAFNAFAKSIGATILDLIGQQLTLLAVQAFGTPQSIATGGAAGALTIALISGLIKGSVSALKGLINSSFEDGGGISPDNLTDLGIFRQGGSLFPAKEGGLIRGDSHQNGGVKFLVKKWGRLFGGEAEGDEIIINKQQQQEGAKLYGKDYLTNMGVPGVGDIGYNAGFTPQIATISEINSNKISSDDMKKFAEMQRDEMQTIITAQESKIIKSVTGAISEALTEAKRKKARGLRAVQNSRF